MENRGNSWWVVFGSAICLIVGNGPVMQFTFGVFLLPVVTDLGTDRATISLALLAGLCVTGLATPVAGKLIDRFGIRCVSLPAILLFSAGIASLGWFTRTPSSFILLYAVLGLVSTGQAPLPYARAVAAAFDRQRGLALGIAMAGVGLGTALLPLFARALISEFGWRTAYVVLGATVFLVAFPTMALLVDRGGRPGHSVESAPAFTEGLDFRRIVRLREFWILAAAFFFVAVGVCGVSAHIIPLLGDTGIAPATATLAISASGLALIAGRLLAGFLLDRLYAPYVAAAFFLAPLFGITIILLSNTMIWAVVATILVGLGLGAEVDLIAFLISRYFGMRAFGETYGYLFATFMIGAGVGPFLMGASYAQLGSYTPALLLSLVGLAASCLLVLCLGRYRFAVDASGGGPNSTRY
ncbi:MAG TPA: MFS transporter [Sphingobium sp.]